MTQIYNKTLSKITGIRVFVSKFFIGWSDVVCELKEQDRKTLEKLQRIKQKREARERNRRMEHLRNCDDLC